ncbi:MAG: phosphoserine phosphatase RsbU/P [Moorella sp. (in: firmicutes)]|nr:phosphoserine phosphatase RsbU/P [Moorella sp. (in: firmicutes)]
MSLDTGGKGKQIIHAGIQGAGCSIPADLEGGDFFDFIPLGEDQLIVAIGDVMGKGMRAAGQMKELCTILHACTRKDLSLLEIIKQLAAIGGKQLHRAGSFATLCLISYEQQHNCLTCLSAGHPSPVIFSGRNIHVPRVRGVALGFLEEYQGTRPEQVVLSRGDVVILYTDGLVEARDAKGQNYGLNRLKEIVAANTCLDAVELQEVILNDLFTFTGCRQQRDDVTLVILKKELEKGGECHGDQGK